MKKGLTILLFSAAIVGIILFADPKPPIGLIQMFADPKPPIGLIQMFADPKPPIG